MTELKYGISKLCKMRVLRIRTRVPLHNGSNFAEHPYWMHYKSVSECLVRYLRQKPLLIAIFLKNYLINVFVQITNVHIAEVNG